MKVMTHGVPMAVIDAMQQRQPMDVAILSAAAPQAPLLSRNGRKDFFQVKPRAKVDFRAMLAMRQAVRNYRPDILHVFWGKHLATSILATANLRPAPKIISFRGIASRPSMFDPGDWITYLHQRVAAHSCESNACRDGLVARGIDAARCHVIYNHVAAQFDRAPRTALAEFDIPPDAFVVMTVATMRRVKGADILLQAARLLDLPHVVWLLVGNVLDHNVARLAKTPELRGRVRMAGFRTDARQLLAAADLFVMPSRNEGLCRALLEAMTQGVCPVVSDAGGMKEVVRHRQDGLVFPRENPEALAAAVRELALDREQRLRCAASAQQRVRTEFSADRMAERTLQMYDRVMGADAPSDYWLPFRALAYQLSGRAAA